MDRERGRDPWTAEVPDDINDPRVVCGLHTVALVSKHPNTCDRLSVLGDFGTDPGSPSAGFYTPKNLSKNDPLVIVLHGRTQSLSDVSTRGTDLRI